MRNKRIGALLLLLCIIFSVCGCGKPKFNPEVEFKNKVEVDVQYYFGLMYGIYSVNLSYTDTKVVDNRYYAAGLVTVYQNGDRYIGTFDATYDLNTKDNTFKKVYLDIGTPIRK